jgi:hypothetical protein
LGTTTPEPQVFFVRNVTESIDPCQNPSFKNSHGFFMSPATAKLTNQPLPIFSQAKPSSFQDLVYPSAYYQRSYRANDKIPWDAKEDQLYWSGRSTGGYTSHNNWKDMHRQRFVELQLRPNEHVPFLSRTNQNGWKWVTAPLSVISRFLNIRFTEIIECAALACMEQKRHFHPSRPDTEGQAFKAKLVMDIDGNTFSGRFYRLLRSNSVVLKQSIFQEWHDDRLVPWAHYIPISPNMTELPETVRYLLDTEEGRTLSQRIAAQSREWSEKVLRAEDLRVAFYRSLLEYAWLVSDNRET